jgi:hypothetical protein
MDTRITVQSEARMGSVFMVTLSAEVRDNTR